MTAAFNRRMRKTARTVVWEGAGAQSPAPDPIIDARDNQETYLIDEACLEEGPVDVTASFKQ